MQLIRSLPLRAEEPTAVAIGNFDGLHLGHRAVVDAMKQQATSQRLVPSVLTFEPHPRQFFSKEPRAFRLQRLKDKLTALRTWEVARIFIPRFNAPFAQISAQVFLDRVLYEQLGARAVIVGENFTFGHQRGGNVALLEKWGAARGVRVTVVPAVRVGGEICSSSAVRKALAAGDMRTAHALLGRAYQLTGRVVHGQGRGRTLGFPTANLALAPELLLPRWGVYAVRAIVSGEELSGVVNLGIRPTVGVDSVPTLEVHLFDTRQDLYGKTLAVSFVHKIRDEKKFDSVEMLKAQIENDCNAAMSLLRSDTYAH